ncbi:MAG: peroxiredoxin-like family protein [Cyanobacteria bacterium P01_A01_bin.114]
MTLATELQNYQAQFRTKAPADIQGVMGKATQDLADSGIIDRALKVGDRIPTVTLPDATGQSFSVQAALEKGPVVLAFYRGGWCPYCNLELKALQQVLPEIKAAGATLIAISPETPDNSLSTSEKNALSFVVLSDVGNRVARDFGLVFQLAEELRPIYKGFGIDIEAYNGDATFELPVPATYVVAPDGDIVYAFANADYTKRAEPADVITALKQVA